MRVDTDTFRRHYADVLSAYNIDPKNATALSGYKKYPEDLRRGACDPADSLPLVVFGCWGNRFAEHSPTLHLQLRLSDGEIHVSVG